MISTKSLLLAGTAVLMLAAATPTPHAAAASGRVLAQAEAPQREGNTKANESKKPERTPQQKPNHEAKPPREKAEQKPAEKPAAQQQREAPKAAPPRERAEPQRGEPQQRERRQEGARPPEAKPSTAAKPAPEKPVNKPAAAEQKPEQKQERNAEQQKQRERNAEPQKPEQKPAAAAPKPAPAPAAAQDKEHKERQAPAAQAPAPEKPAAQKPAAQSRPQQPTEQPAAKPQQPAAQSQPQQPAAQAPAATTTAPEKGAPIGSAQNAAPTMAPPQKPQSPRAFILPPNGKPTATIQDVRKERQERREGNRTVITEGDRTIVKEDNRVIIRHNEAQRFAVGARDVNVQRQGNETTTVIVRPNGDRIVNVTDADGRLLRRVRRDPRGREIVIIDERRVGPRDLFVNLPPPVVRIPRDRYIVELDRARPQVIYEVLDAPPVERIERPYTISQVRYSAPLRERMPRLDLDINFDTGSWQLTPDQVDKLSVVAEGLNRAIDRNPREVFLIEGHTDAVGSDEDNLSLSDRRAESVAVALTEQFQVPPENLVTQGYGEQDLKVQTEGASRANRRVSVRRITPLIDAQAAR